MRKQIILLALCASACTALACKPRKPIVILHDNDVHCAIERYPQVKCLYDRMTAADTAYIGLASSGDLIQGAVAGTLSEGRQVIDVLRVMPYDAITLGNHEFDYGTERMFELMARFGNERVSCVNFSDKKGHFPFGSYVMKRYGHTKVAFVGVLTPNTMIDEKRAFITPAGDTLYTLQNDDRVVEIVQTQVNKARKAGAKYVIVLSHMGEKDVPLTSVDLISRTYGIDAVLDGHTHTLLPQQLVKNKKGQLIPLTQTGQKLDNIGKLYISPDGKVEASVLSLGEVGKDPRVQAVVDSIAVVNAPTINQRVGYSEVKLTNMSADGKTRLVRNTETNTGNLAADAIRWYAKSDIAFANGGGLRKDIPEGEVTLGEVIDMQPFNNDINVYEVPGRVLVEMIRYASAVLRTQKESGMLIQPSGFHYVYSKSQDRVLEVTILNPATGVYEPLQPDKIYSLAVAQYNFSQYGTIVAGCRMKQGNLGLDNMITKTFIEQALGGRIGQEYAAPQGRFKIVE